MLRRDDGDRTEFITLSMWDSVEAIKAFAGDDIEAAVLYPEDERYLVGESSVTHYEVVDQALWFEQCESPARAGLSLRVAGHGPPPGPRDTRWRSAPGRRTTSGLGLGGDVVAVQIGLDGQPAGLREVVGHRLLVAR